MPNRYQKMEARLRNLDPSLAESTEKVDLMVEIAEELLSGDNPQRMIEITTEARELSRKIGYVRGEAYAHIYSGLSQCFIAEHKRGIDEVVKGREKFEEIGDEIGASKSRLIEANLYRSIGSFDHALSQFHRSIELYRQNGLRSWEGWAYYDIGLLYQEIGDHKRALESYETCQKILKDVPRRWFHGRVLNGIGVTLLSMGRHEEALEHHQRSLAIFQEIENPMGEARARDDIGSIYLHLGDHDKALEYHTRSLEIRRAIGQRRAEGTSLINIARVHVVQEQPDLAIDCLEKAMTIAEETGSKAQIYAVHELLSLAFELKEDYPRALKHHKEFQRNKERVFSEQAADRIRKLEVSFGVEKAEKEAEIARLKNIELAEKNEQLELLLKELQATQGHLVQAEKMAALGKLVAGLVHEMNTPLGASNSAIDVAARCIDKIRELNDTDDSLKSSTGGELLVSHLSRIRENQEVIRGANDRLSKLLGNLKSFIWLDGSERDTVDVHEGLDNALALLEHELGDRIEVVKEYGDLPAVECCVGEMNQVFMNLLTNAAEAIEGKGTITIRTFQEGENLHVEIEDDGAGIPTPRLETLFDPDFSSKGPRVKAGIGLFASLNIIRKHGGRIGVESEIGKGSKFTIVVPMEEERRFSQGSAGA